METLWTGLKALRVWQYLVLAATLIGAAGATYGAYAVVTSTGGQALGDNQRLIPVQFGNLVNQVRTNGSLVFPNRLRRHHKPATGRRPEQSQLHVDMARISCRLGAAPKNTTFTEDHIWKAKFS